MAIPAVLVAVVMQDTGLLNRKTWESHARNPEGWGMPKGDLGRMLQCVGGLAEVAGRLARATGEH